MSERTESETLSMRMTRRTCRVLLVLLSDAANLSIYPIMRTAGVSSGKVTVLLAARRSDEKPRRRFYRLTGEGRQWALDALRLTARKEAEESADA